MDEALDHLHRAVHAELREKEGNLPALGREDLLLRRQVPELALERADRLLPRRVDELFVGLAILALFGGVAETPGLHCAMKLGRERRVLEERVLEACREVDLGRL